MKPRRKLAPSRTHATTRRVSLPARKAPRRPMEAMLRDAAVIAADDGTVHGVNAELAYAVCSTLAGYLPPVELAEALAQWTAATIEEDHVHRGARDRSRELMQEKRRALVLAAEFYDVHLATMEEEGDGASAGGGG